METTLRLLDINCYFPVYKNKKSSHKNQKIQLAICSKKGNHQESHHSKMITVYTWEFFELLCNYIDRFIQNLYPLICILFFL